MVATNETYGQREKWRIIATIISLQLTVVDGIKAIFHRIIKVKPFTQASWLALVVYNARRENGKIES